MHSSKQFARAVFHSNFENAIYKYVYIYVRKDDLGSIHPTFQSTFDGYPEEGVQWFIREMKWTTDRRKNPWRHRTTSWSQA